MTGASDHTGRGQERERIRGGRRRGEQRENLGGGRRVAAMDGEWWRKKLVAWAAASIFVVLMLVTPAIPPPAGRGLARLHRPVLPLPRDPYTLNVLSNIHFLFVGLAGLILCHYKNYFRLWGSSGVGHFPLLVSLLSVLVHPTTISTRMMPP